jgi:hypothetical protein
LALLAVGGSLAGSLLCFLNVISLTLIVPNKLHDNHYVLSVICVNLFALELLLYDDDGVRGSDVLLFVSKSNLNDNISVTPLYIS